MCGQLENKTTYDSSHAKTIAILRTDSELNCNFPSLPLVL